MEYTKIETELIKESFKEVRNEFDHDLSIENDEEVIKALNIHRDRYYMNAEKQKIAVIIFEKHGLWKNGRMTIEEHDRAELKKKVNQVIQFKNARKKQLNRLKDLQVSINKSISQLEEEPKKITNTLYEERKKIQSQAYDQIADIETRMKTHLNQTIINLRENYEKEIKIIVNNLNDDIEQLKQKEKFEINKIIEEYDSLIKLKQEYMELEDEYQEEVQKLDLESKRTDANLFDLTVRELKEIADNKNIEYPHRILKADLINLIQNQ